MESSQAARIDYYMDPFLFSILRCPECLSPVDYAAPGPPADLVCLACRRRYPMFDPGIPSLLARGAGESAAGREKNRDARCEEAAAASAPMLDVVERIAIGYARGNVLEVGCSAGRLLWKLGRAQHVTQAVGIDVSAASLCAATERGLALLVHGSGERLPFEDGAFDTVVAAFGSLMDIDRAKAYPEIARVLNDGGTLVFDRINYGTEWLGAVRRRLRAPGRSIAYPPRHKTPSARREVRLLERAGFRLVDLKSVPYVPFLEKKIQKPWCWSGYWAARFGRGTVFVARKSGRRRAGGARPARALPPDRGVKTAVSSGTFPDGRLAARGEELADLPEQLFQRVGLFQHVHDAVVPQARSHFRLDVTAGK